MSAHARACVSPCLCLCVCVCVCLKVQHTLDISQASNGKWGGEGVRLVSALVSEGNRHVAG